MIFGIKYWSWSYNIWQTHYTMNCLLIHECAIVVLLLHQFVFFGATIGPHIGNGSYVVCSLKKMDLFNHIYYFNNSTTWMLMHYLHVWELGFFHVVHDKKKIVYDYRYKYNYQSNKLWKKYIKKWSKSYRHNWIDGFNNTIVCPLLISWL